MLFAPRLEPFGQASLEAGVCGVPVVAVAEDPKTRWSHAAATQRVAYELERLGSPG